MKKDNAIQKALIEKFDAEAPTYSRVYDPRSRGAVPERFRMRREVIGAVAASLSGDLLDCAAGTGEITATVIEHGAISSVTVNDISPQMLARCRAKLASVEQRIRCRWLNEDVFDLGEKLPPASFDVVLAIGLLGHVGRLRELLAVLASLTRPGGAILLHNPITDHVGVRITAWAVALARPILHRNLHFVSLDEIREASLSVGLRIEKVRRFGVCVPFGNKILTPWGNEWVERRVGRRLVNSGGEAIVTIRKPR